MIVGSITQLRPLRLDDAERVVRWRNEPFVAEQMFSAPPTLEDHLRWFDGLSKSTTREEFIICERDDAAKPVGTIGLSAIDRHHRRAEYGIVIGESAALGRGLAADASRLILNYAFDSLGLHRVFLHLFRDNARALRLYERLGFTAEGLLRRHAMRRGEFVDVIVMGLLREEWVAAR